MKGGWEEFLTKFILAKKKLNEVITILNEISKDTDWTELKEILNQQETQTIVFYPNKTEEEFVPLNLFVHNCNYIFSERTILDKMRKDDDFFKACGRNVNGEYQVKKYAAIEYLSNMNGKLGNKVRDLIRSNELLSESCGKPIC